MSTIFPIQKDGKFGRVEHKHQDDLFEQALGEQVVREPGSRSYLGLTIPMRRFRFGVGVLAAMIMLLTGRSAYLQVVQGDHYAALAAGNRYRTHTLVPPRGIVYDRHGEILIENVPSFVLTMTIADLPEEDDASRDAVLNQAADLAGLHRTDVDLLLTEHAASPLEPIPVKKGLDYESAMRLAVAVSTLPGFRLETSSTRSYQTSASSLSHVLGYMGKLNQEEYEANKTNGYRATDEIGKAGIERSAESLLRGTPGKLVEEVDAQGNEMSLVSKEDPVPGANITLAIDTELQAFIQQRIEAMTEKWGMRKAAVIAMDPQTGAIRALVSMPSYDSNAFANGIDAELYQRLLDDPDNPLFPRAVSGEYPSGSTFKPYIAYAALSEGVVTPSTSFVSVGGIHIGPWFFPDWKAGGHGVTNVRKAIAESVNTFFYIVGGGYENVTGLGVERITDYARQFGFGARTGIDLPNEAEGFLPSKEWKVETKGEQWYVGDTYHLAIGQGDLLVTPIQLASALAIVANGGHPVTPHLIESVNGVAENPLVPAPRDQTFRQDAIQVVREGMRQTVTAGSARSLSTLPYPVAGKTGTAQTTTDKPTHAWFTGFGPYDEPTLAVTVLVEYGGEGSSIATPIAKDVFEWWFAHEPQNVIN